MSTPTESGVVSAVVARGMCVGGGGGGTGGGTGEVADTRPGAGGGSQPGGKPSAAPYFCMRISFSTFVGRVGDAEPVMVAMGLRYQIVRTYSKMRYAAPARSPRTRSPAATCAATGIPTDGDATGGA